MINLLALTQDQIENTSIGMASLYALIGFAVVFLGITLLVVVISLMGVIFDKIPAMFKKGKKKKPVPAAAPIVQQLDDLDDETVAVITAAIMAYYQKQQVPCDFVIKKIKRSKI